MLTLICVNITRILHSSVQMHIQFDFKMQWWLKMCILITLTCIQFGIEMQHQYIVVFKVEQKQLNFELVLCSVLNYNNPYS